MSSATSISKAAPKGRKHARGVRLPADPNRARQADGQTDAGFRPWHFFVLASLMAATAAVVLTKQSTPENLVLISVTIGAAGVAAAGFYRMLAPLATEDISMFSEPLTERQRAALQREKALVLRSIKELEFDRAMGKVSPKDFEEMSGRLRTRALSLMKELDDGGSGYREIIERELNARLAGGRLKADVADAVALKPDTTEPEQTTAARLCTCGTAADGDAAFCKRCGARLAS